MPFFPDSIYGLAYLAALVVFGAITWAGPNHAARNILLVLTIHWFTTRAIDVYDHTNFWLWIAQDYVFFAALLLCGGGRPALACAALFLVMVGFDSYSLVIGGSFTGASAVAETLGYLAMLCMAGGAYGDGGKLARTSGSGSSIFRVGKTSIFQGRLYNAGRSRQPVEGMGRAEKVVKVP